MNNALQGFYFKGLPEQQAHLDHLIDFATAQSSGSLSAAEVYYRPPADSELNRECKEAFRVLAKLEADEDFQQFLREKPEPDDSILGRDFLYNLLSTLFSSARSPIPDPPETFSIADHSVILRHMPTYWYIDADVLLDINRRVGNGLKSDGSVRFDLVLKYYSIIPALPKTGEQWKAVLCGLQEHRTLRKLGHEGDLSDLEHLLDAPADQKIKEVIREIETQTRQSLFRHVLPDTFTAPQQEMLTTTPTVLLEQLLNSPENLALAERIARALDWYGSQKDETCPQPVLVKLLWRALWLTIIPNPDSTIDNELKLFITPGASYKSIRQDLISRYHHNLSISTDGAQLAVCVVKAHVASEVWVADIPDDLPYAAASTWVNFRSGFVLAESLAPGSSRHMSFEQLLNLAAEHFRVSEGDVKQQALVAAARLAPTVQWAQANGLIASRASGHSRDELTQAVTALEQHEYELFNAVQNLKLNLPSRWRFASDTEYDKAFREALEVPRNAYKTLIQSLLAHLGSATLDVDQDEITVYSLREALNKVPIEYETKAKTDAVRYRTGFILRIVKPRSPFHALYIEVFPFAGLIRRRREIKALPLNGKVVELRDAMSWDKYRLATEVPFDREAYRENKAPRPGKKAQLIVEQVGETLPVIDAGPRIPSFAPNTLYAPRSETLASMIARELFFCDEQALLEKTRKDTRKVDIPAEVLEDLAFWGKIFIPLWGGIDDIASGDPQRIKSGVASLFIDIVAFALPVGRYVAGSTRLLIQAGKTGVRLALPKLAKLTGKLVIGTLQELNPLAALPSLLRLARFGLLKLGHKLMRQAKRGIAQLRDGTIAARHMRSVDPDSWKPLQAGDQLFTVDGFANVPMRNVGSLDAPDYRLIDTAANKAFGPRFREPITVISNSSPLIRQYAVDPELIRGLKPDARGIFSRTDYNQKFICNVDDKGKIAVYQVRDNSYGFIQETAAGADNSFSIVLVNPKTNRDLSITLSSVEPGHWYSSPIKLSGGAPDAPSVVTPSVLLKWTEASEDALKKTMDNFVSTYNLDPSAFRQFVNSRNTLTPRGQKMLDRAGTARTSVTYEHMEHWSKASQRERNSLTLEGFAADHNLDPVAFADHVNPDGTYKAAGKVLAKYARGEQFNALKPEHLQEWNKHYNATNSRMSMHAFVEQKNLDPVIWSSYVNDNGSMTRAGRERWLFGQRSPQDQPVARKRPAVPTAGSSKRPRLEDDILPTRRRSTSITASFDHKINNNAPILQDPKDVRRSLTLELEGPLQNIEITDANHFFDEFTGPQYIEVKEAATKSIRDWIAKEGNHHRRLDRLLEVKKLADGPQRGLSVVARTDIKRFDVIGPYTGKLHLDQASLNTEIVEKSEAAVGTYLFQTNTHSATVSGHGNSNTLSLINAVKVPNLPDAGIKNVGALYVGKYMVFLVAWRDIPAGTELLMDYGKAYWKYIRP
ncbi:SET domain-containing protein [Pseudomonas orientalis]|uniref:SET domain-containing protein-lysine N-methyltransferase n=1 Tax=Pseudomonas orientalis TaxID=76758 RepID=A0A2L0RX56_9PSED|nr:SET domain-containing protein [Pseudomonas orientalis]AUZ46687.1 SET domain-containing protein-lysine N-methyltransferase [Pseudomonas orientalis]